MANANGCWEDVPHVWDELKTAKSNAISISAVWLDIANFYSSISHQLISYSLKNYVVNTIWTNLLASYYKGICSKSFFIKKTKNICLAQTF